MEETDMADVLDSNGEVIGQVTLREAREKRLLHRAAGVIVVNSKGELLVYRKSMAADNGGKYSIIVDEEVKAGDTYMPTAARIVREKLRLIKGRESVNIQAIFPFRYNGDEANIDFGLFLCVYDGILDPNPVDIGEHFFSSLAEIEKLMQEKPFLRYSAAIFKAYRERMKL
jgi:hypothetical protein